MLSPEELPGYRVAALSRVSNISKKAESSLNRQDKRLINEINTLKDDYNAEVVKTYRNKQSASTMDRDSLNEILEMAKNDEFDILMVWAIHRLTRASLPDTMEYILALKNEGIILYSDRDGYFDWDDPDDFSTLMDRIKNAREWRNEIVEGAIRACRDRLSKGHWPYGPIGYGLVDKEEDGISIIEGYRSIIQETFKIYTECEDEGTTADLVAERFENKKASLPTEYQVAKMLENELYTGRLVIRQTGEFVREKENIDIIPQKLFDKVQEIRSRLTKEKSGPENKEKSGPDQQELPAEIYDLICRYGQEYAVENVSAIRWCCPECNSTDINVSSTIIQRLGINIPRIYCHNDDGDDDCGYQGPAIRQKELNEIDMSLPLICPDCQRTEKFDVEKTEIETGDIDTEENLYKYTCHHCDSWMMKNASPDPNVRGLHSSNSISLRNSNRKYDNKSTEEKQTESDNTENEDEAKIELTTVLEEYLERAGPNKAVAQDVMITAANILAEDGPMNTANLKSKLNESYGEEYSSKDSLWESTFARLYTEIPGFTKVSYGEYDFNQQRLNVLVNSILES